MGIAIMQMQRTWNWHSTEIIRNGKWIRTIWSRKSTKQQTLAVACLDIYSSSRQLQLNILFPVTNSAFIRFRSKQMSRRMIYMNHIVRMYHLRRCKSMYLNWFNMSLNYLYRFSNFEWQSHKLPDWHSFEIQEQYKTIIFFDEFADN